MARKKPRKGEGAKANKSPRDPDDLMRLLHARMEAEETAEGLNDNVVVPFAAALEDVCAARGYVLNIYGEKSNVVFTGSEADAEAIYGLIEDYLNKKA